MENIRRILVLCRMTPYCGFAIKAGVSLARKFGAELYAIRLLTGPLDVGVVNAPGFFPSEAQQYDFATVEEEAKKELDEAIRYEVSRGFPIKELVGTGSPVDDIEKAVRDEQIDLIIMLAHSESRLEHFLFGGENAAVIRRLPCSVLLVKKEPEPVE